MSTGNIKNNFWGVKCGWCVRLTNLLPSMSQLFRQCGILNISQPCRLRRPVTGIAFFFSLCLSLIEAPRAVDCISKSVDGPATELSDKGPRCVGVPECCTSEVVGESFLGPQYQPLPINLRKPFSFMSQELASRPTRKLMTNCFWIILFTLY
jgi:hypothetical protein